MKRYKVIAGLSIILFLVSAICNVFQYNNTKNYKRAVNTSLAYFFSHYHPALINNDLKNVINNGKIYYQKSESIENMVNGLQRDFIDLSNMHQELTGMYGTLSSFKHSNRINNYGYNNITFTLLQFSVFFDYLYINNASSLVLNKKGLYMHKLSEEELQGVEIISQITEDLSKLLSESSSNTLGHQDQELKEYMMKSADYFHSEEVQEKIEIIMNMNKASIDNNKANEYRE